jgi:heat shock protein HtpX
VAVHGYITHAARNQRFTAWLVLGYVLAFELVGAFALTMLLLLFDEEHTILSNPLGYAVRYALPLAGFSAFLFWRLYRGHAKAVAEELAVRIVSRQDEPRFVAIAEEACATLGVRLPRFGILEAPEPNAVTVGEGPNNGLIAVTRGLLEQLDDDELAAVLAHEASHVRQGDTKLLAANHALMRTAVLLQTHNPLRLEDWRQMIIPLLMPPMLLIMLAGSAATMFSMQLARAARRGLKLGRDHGADGEAIRVTHFPEALISALTKVGGNGAFAGSYRVEGMLFDGPADHEGGSHPAVQDRLNAIAKLGRGLMDPRRLRRDTRGPARAHFGRNRAAASIDARYDREGRPTEQPPTGTLRMLTWYFTDRAAYREWQRACIAWYEWRVSDQRNAIGLTPKMVIPVAAVATFLLIFHWPADGDFSKFAAKFRPDAMVDLARQVNSGPFCEGPSYKDGKCPGYDYSGKSHRSPSFEIAAATSNTAVNSGTSAAQGPPSAFGGIVGIMMMAFLVIAMFKPKWLRWLFGVVRTEDRDPVKQPMPKVVVRPKPKQGEDNRETYDQFDVRVQERLNELERSQTRVVVGAPVSTFGRKKV